MSVNMSPLLDSKDSIHSEALADTIIPDDEALFGSEGQSPREMITTNLVIFQVRSITITLSQLRYFTYLFIGISILWPWNCFLSASGYFIEKFGKDSGLSNNYSSTMMTVSTLTSLIFNSYLSTKQSANFDTRMKVGSFINFIIFGVLALIELLAPNLHNTVYFVFLMILVFSSSLGTCLQQNGCMSKVNVLGPRYAQAVMVGQAIAGVFPSISLIITNMMYNKPTDDGSSTSIVLYFGTTSIITLFAALLLEITNRFNDEADGFVVPTEDFENHVVKTEYVPFMRLFKQLKFIVSSIFTVFFVSLVFAIFASNITSVHNWGNLTSDSIFIPFIFLVWNVGDLLGRIVCAFPQVLIQSDTKLFAYSLLRFFSSRCSSFVTLTNSKAKE